MKVSFLQGVRRKKEPAGCPCLCHTKARPDQGTRHIHPNPTFQGSLLLLQLHSEVEGGVQTMSSRRVVVKGQERQQTQGYGDASEVRGDEEGKLPPWSGATEGYSVQLRELLAAWGGSERGCCWAPGPRERNVSPVIPARQWSSQCARAKVLMLALCEKERTFPL